MSGTGRGGSATRTTYGGIIGTATQKWWQGVKAGNGKIYCIPYDEEDILVINPATDTATKITGAAPVVGAFKRRFLGGALGSDGKIYCPPFIFGAGTDEFLIIDPSSNTFSYSRFGLAPASDPPGPTRIFGCRGAVALSGGSRIVFPKSGSGGGGTMIDLNVGTLTATIRGSSTVNGYNGGAYRASDNQVYFAPYGQGSSTQQCMRFNPSTNLVTFLNTFSSRTYASAHVMPDGNVYFMPEKSTHGLRYRGGVFEVVERHYSNGWGHAFGYNSTGFGYFGAGADMADGRVYVPPLDEFGWIVFEIVATPGPPHDVPSRSGYIGAMTDFGIFMGERYDPPVGSEISSQPSKWSGAVQADDGRVFTVPWDGRDVCVVEPDDMSPDDPIADADQIPRYGAGAAHGGRRPNDIDFDAQDLTLGPLLWDTREWTGVARDITDSGYETGTAYRAMPNLGTAGDFLDLHVWTYDTSGPSFAGRRWNNGEILKWSDFQGVHGDAPWTWMVAIDEMQDGDFVEILVDLEASGTTFSLYAQREDGDPDDCYIQWGAAGYAFKNQISDWAGEVNGRLFVSTEDYQAGGTTHWAGIDVPVPQTNVGPSPPDGQWDAYNGVHSGDYHPADQVGLDDWPFFFHPFNSKFLWLDGHRDGPLPTPGDSWSPVRGVALVRAAPTARLLQAWHNYWF